MKMSAFLVPVFIVGCANLDDMSEQERAAYLEEREDLRYQREVELIEAREQYYMTRAACRKNGGVMVIPRKAGHQRTTARESKREYLYARCIRW